MLLAADITFNSIKLEMFIAFTIPSGDFTTLSNLNSLISSNSFLNLKLNSHRLDRHL